MEEHGEWSALRGVRRGVLDPIPRPVLDPSADSCAEAPPPVAEVH